MIELNFHNLAEQLEIVIHQVENGEVFTIKRRKIPIAEITPIKNSGKPKWKQSIKKLVLPDNLSGLPGCLWNGSTFFYRV